MRKFWLFALGYGGRRLSPAQMHSIARMKAGLLALDPETRLEQRCDAEVADRIANDDKRFDPDKVIAYATRGAEAGRRRDQDARRRLPKQGLSGTTSPTNA